MTAARDDTAGVAAVRVTATDLATGDSDDQDIWDDYCIVTAGGCDVTNVGVHYKADGTQTHILTVKGVRRRG